MFLRYPRRLFLLQLLLFSAGRCQPASKQEGGRLVIGVISYEAGEQVLNQYDAFNRYLSEKVGARIEIEPTFNENKAIERVENHGWSMVFAPPGLAALAISRAQYLPILPLQGIANLRSVLVVRDDSSIQSLKQLQGETIALGQPGSATGYYLPLYNLYGLTLAQVLFAPTPKTILEWVAEGKAMVGALSIAEFKLYSQQINSVKFRVLFTDVHNVPSGAVLIGPDINRNRQERIQKAMSAASPELSQSVGYVPQGAVPDYQYMISVVERVRPLTARLAEKPVPLF